MGHVQINLFGSFHVERDGKSVDEQLARSPKGMLLMQYLILAPRQTAEAKTLMQVMWPEENSTSPDTALKTLISRQRALLREISPELAMCLVTVRGGYRWVCPPEVSVDVLEFEEMLARMKLPGGCHAVGRNADADARAVSGALAGGSAAAACVALQPQRAAAPAISANGG